MCRSEPQMPLASTRTRASSAAVISGSGFSSTRTSLAAWKVTARIGRRERYRSAPGQPRKTGSADRGALFGLEAVGAFGRACRLGNPRLQRELLLEVGGLGMLEGDVFGFHQLDEDLHELGVELFAGDAAQLDDRVLGGHRRAVGV